ncbi:outer membrane insertion C- signal [Saccharicrinis aurantiacus]|uniref:outer membrane insertion C- signal n=1 Tax=Saccharicrinis aurantiacus TaxID=1849719 RepID=UPI00094FE52A|nr:outer membrane insertion C- signal [Saccharicrinis aurantiacus]
MKKLLFIALVITGLAASANAQEVGVRFGSFSGNNVAIDGVFGLGEFSRIHADVSFGDGVGIDALWDFLYKPLGDVEGLNWYTGAGVTTFIGDDFKLGVAGEIGIEYHFAGVPIALGIDWRPTLEIIDNTSFNADSFGFNARFCF